MAEVQKDLNRIFQTVHPEVTENLYHVGTMDISKKSKFSCEGNGLSVSNCPDEWVAITEGFTHGDYFKLSKSDMKLLDFYGLSDGEKKIMQDWAIEHGYVQEGTLYKCISWDEEGFECYSLFDSFEVALEESDYEEDRVFPVSGFRPTEKLIDQSMVKVELLDVPNIIAELYAEQVLDYDGVYWDEVLDVSVYSAPRGVIFNSKVSTFDVINITQANKVKVPLEAQIQSASARVAESHPADKTPARESTHEH